MSLESQELEELKSKIGRDPTSTELQIVAAEWSEHCSYKSSKRHLKMLPMDGPLVITEKGYDSGVLDVGSRPIFDFSSSSSCDSKLNSLLPFVPIMIQRLEMRV